MSKLAQWQKKFKVKLDQMAKKVKDFSVKDRMNDAESYVYELNTIGEQLEEFNKEVCGREQNSYFITIS